MEILKKVFKYGEHDVTLETGGLARQATASVKVTMGETVVLVTVVAKKKADKDRDFFPLTVNYIEKFYATGRVPGGFLRREGRPGDHESLTARLIDRPLRPLFPKGFFNEIQVVATVMSFDPDVASDVVALIGASCALSLAGVPFAGPVGAARVGYDGENYTLNPSTEKLESSYLDLVVAGTDNAVLMVESDAKELPEDIMMGAVLYGHEQMQVVIQAINELVESSGRTLWEQNPVKLEDKELGLIKKEVAKEIEQAFLEKDKLVRYELRSQYVAKAQESLVSSFANEQTDEADAKDKIAKLIDHLEYNHVRESILSGKPRIDGRDTKTVRPILVETGVLPRTHGSAVFTRGETQAIVVTTLGSEKDSQLLENLYGQTKDKFMLHYNFPPYSVGETGMMGSPKRREIGHGSLAKRAVKHMLPSEKDWPYTIRVVSEITESNGSSSMASVCGASLSMMHAGIPIKAPVAGVAMGLIKEGDRYAVLTDILGDEDHLGDMDFKVAGTKDGITALQMDIKITGITKEIMEVALKQAKEGRMHILGIMNDSLSKSNSELSPYAPRFERFSIDPDKIRDVIGKGGAVIRSISESTGASVDISDAGVVSVFAPSNAALTEVLAKIEDITEDAEIGVIYDGEVVRIADFGAFVKILPNKDGLLHISQIAEGRVEKVTDVLNIGDKIRVKVLDVDKMGRVKLSRKDVLALEGEAASAANTANAKVEAASDKPAQDAASEPKAGVASEDKPAKPAKSSRSRGKLGTASKSSAKSSAKSETKPDAKADTKSDTKADTKADPKADTKAEDSSVNLSKAVTASAEDDSSA